MPAQRLSAIEERWLQNSVTQRRGQGVQFPRTGQQMLGLGLLLGGAVPASHAPPAAQQHQQQHRRNQQRPPERAK